MSHLTSVKTKMKELDMLKSAIEATGCKLDMQTKTYSSRYTRPIDCVGVIHAEGQQITQSHGAAVIQDESGYQIVLDNYGNSLTRATGNNCEKITQKYAEMVSTEEMINAGWMQQGSYVDEKTGDLLMEFVS